MQNVDVIVGGIRVFRGSFSVDQLQSLSLFSAAGGIVVVGMCSEQCRSVQCNG